MITFKEKDIVLDYIVRNDNYNLTNINLNNSFEILGLNSDLVHTILLYFEDEGLIRSYTRTNDRHASFFVNVVSHDLLTHGGFMAIEENLQNDLKKLILEIESLKPSFPDKAETITNIISNITATIASFFTFKN